MRIRNKMISVISIIAICFGIASCSSNSVSSVDIDKKVEASYVNDASDLVSRGFIEAVFNKDEELFKKCFPDGYVDGLKESDNIDLFTEYTSILTVDGEFLGTKYKAYNEYNTDSGYDEDYMRENISLSHGLESKDIIDQMQIVKLEVLFNIDGKNMKTEVYFLAYRVADKWYAFEMADADAEFKY